EYRLEHDGEVIPEAEQAAPEGTAEDAGHADGERRGAAGSREERRLPHLVCKRLHLLHRDGKSPARDRVHGRCRRTAYHTHSAVDGEEDAGIEQRRGNHGHDGDERLQHHAAITDETHIRLARDELGRRATRDERVKPGDRAAGDGDEDEGKYLAAEERAMAVDEGR